MNASYHKNLEKLFPGGRGLFLAYDQGFEHGPTDFSGENADPEFIMRIAAYGHFNGVMVHHGVAEKYYEQYEHQVPLILKMNGKTALHNEEPLSKAVTSVEEAVRLKASAVGYTVYVGSEHESEMLAELGQIIEQAHGHGLPVFGWMYPRGKAITDPHDPDTIAYAARVGLEVGVDVVKIYYPHDPTHLAEAVKVAGKTKVVVAGGAKQDPTKLADEVKGMLKAGAAGLAVGRNVWQAEQPNEVAKKLREVIDGQN